MAKLKGVVSCAMMDRLAGRLRGGLDFYFWKGIPCVRIWPYGAERVQSFARAASAAAFALIAEQKAVLPAIIRQSLAWLAAGSTWTWGDLFTHYAMDYYKSIGDIPPAITDIVYTTGSGLVTLAFTLDRSAAPSLQTFRRGQAKIIYKNYRGAAEKCIEPDPIFDDSPIPVPLVVTGSVLIPVSLQSSEKYALTTLQSEVSYAANLQKLIDKYLLYTPTHFGGRACQSMQRLEKWAYSYKLRMWAYRYDGVWVATNVGGHALSEFNGVQYTVSKSVVPGFSGGFFSCVILGVPVSEPVENLSPTVRTHPASFFPGTSLPVTLMPPWFYAPPHENIFRDYPTGLDLNAAISVSDIALTLGPKGRYVYTFPTPEDRPVMLGFVGGGEKFFPMFAIYPGGVA